MAELKKFESGQAGVESERHEIDRIKGLLREMVRDAERGREGAFFGATAAPLQVGRDLLASIDAVVEQELAELTKGGEGR
jgi:hypothetical protein